ncbi:MAG TPA: hypothetical protein PLO67_06115 [Saprospiraceae bacterium]|nr:hypothetical protein [Saprospiraceae bacterium]HPI05729.1 hypothetical protein [Saprospiraceae bacterium]
MKNNQLDKNKKEDHPETTGKLPVLTPDGKKENRDVKEEETPDADQHAVTPKQPLYEDKTEAYYRKKQQPKR